MKKKLNLFCVLILVLKVAQIVIGNVLSFGENAKAFNQGWEEGGKADAGFEFWGGFAIVMLGLACLFLIIRSLIAFVRFILNVNRNKVFVWENAIHDLLEHIQLDRIYNNTIDDFIFSVFCLIMAEVFMIGLKLKEEQDLTI